MRIKIRSTTLLISLGLACLTLSVVLMAHSLGIAPDTAQPLLRARLQAAELVAAQCAPAGAAGDITTMAAIVREVAARNPDLASAGLRRADGRLAFEYGPHHQNWGNGQRNASSAFANISVPIGTDKADWGSVEFCFRQYSSPWLSRLPSFLAQFLASPGLRVAVFVAAVGFVCYFFYLRRTLRHLDPSSVIPPRVRAMLDALAEGIVVLDSSGTIIMANDSFGRATGLKPDSLQGHKAGKFDWTDPVSGQPCQQLPWAQVLSTGQPVKGTPLALRITGACETGSAAGSSAPAAERQFSVNATPILGPDGRVRGALATFDDVTEIEKMNALLKESRDEVEQQNVQLRILATTDPLTGCSNRRHFLEQFDKHWKEARAANTPLGCIILDIDKFKSINDRFGHTAGDSVLKDVSRIVRTTVADLGLVCRYGGEEFSILLPGRDIAATADFAEQLRKNIESEKWQICPVTSSFGASSTEFDAPDVKGLLDLADQALYASKRTGRNRVTRCDAIPAAASAPEVPAVDARAVAPTPSALVDHTSQAGFLALVSALAHRSAATAMHSRRVADLCMLASPGLLGADQASQLEVAALLHDVGKIGVPDSILNKPGKLTAEEWDLMRFHDKMSVDLVAIAGLPASILCLVAAHHEKCGADDTPPDELTLAARLLTIADSYDAMTSDRPYRKRMPQDAAIAELRRCSGSHFDPAVTEHFISALLRASSSDSPPRQAA